MRVITQPTDLCCQIRNRSKSLLNNGLMNTGGYRLFWQKAACVAFNGDGVDWPGSNSHSFCGRSFTFLLFHVWENWPYMIYVANSRLQDYISPKPITKTLVNVSSPRGPPTALLPLPLCFWGCEKQLKAPPVSAFLLPPLLGNWKPLSIGAGVRPHLQLIFHTAAPLKPQNKTKYWAAKLFSKPLTWFGGHARKVCLFSKIFSRSSSTSQARHG